MSNKEGNAYILGTDYEELFRLGLQHQLWASDAHFAWKQANFTAGQTILDLGCGPGFCAKELAFLVGASGEIIGVDKSQYYIDHLQKVSDLHQLNINAIAADFNDMDLSTTQLDGMYCRWALAWIDNPIEILEKVIKSMKSGARLAIHEYYDWSTHQTEPKMPNLSIAIAAALESFMRSEGDINIGRRLPTILSELGMNIVSTRPMSKLARAHEDFWHWPKSFYYSYFPRLVEMGLLSESVAKEALNDLTHLEKTEGATLCCPLMIEVVAEKK